VVMDEWIEQYSTPEEEKPARTTKGRKPTKSPVAPRPPAKKKPAPRTPKAADEVAPDRSAIGSNPERRFVSASSRNLARKP